MLDIDTRRRIDTARDILVGKVPDPKSQVEQITIALIYKFMDDMDAEAEELGGRRTFFAGEFAQYGWAKLLAPGGGGQAMLTLYDESIRRMPENPGIPRLFRDIFKNAYLPYRDPETLRAFLKVINDFTYDHSERLGDAFEYLLSVLGSQGDAGQFRTPRHIIDFMVAIVDPRKEDTILDPACGTAGFLISAYKHVLAANARDGRPGAALSPAERARLMGGVRGYDISPDMVRLSLVNLYLHGFADPHVDEYDTLTSDSRWNEHATVILANPPFMSPKGGIRPHKRFSVQSNRSEVLFVDYIAEHLAPGGRAAVIVPEGVIFQSGTAYARLRKLLLDEHLTAVLSLPSGVFQPYTGVKTSILILDRRLAKVKPDVLFADIQHIGVSLGIKRTVTERNDLPQVIQDYRAYVAGNLIKSDASFTVPRDEIAKTGYLLDQKRYRRSDAQASHFHLVSLGKVCHVEKGKSSSTKTLPGPYPLILTAEDFGSSDHYDFDADAVCVPLISSSGHGKATMKRVHYYSGKFALADLLAAVTPKDKAQLNARFLYLVLDAAKNSLTRLMSGAANVSMKTGDLTQFEIPLPPLPLQEALVAEVASYQRIIDGARQVVANWRPRIEVDPAWPVVALGEVCTVNPKKNELSGTPAETLVSFVPMADLNENQMDFTAHSEKSLSDVIKGYTYFCDGDVLLAKVTPCFENGKAGIAESLRNGIGFGSSEYIVLRAGEKVLPIWVYLNATSEAFREEGTRRMTGTGGLQRVPIDFVTTYPISVPSIEVQQEVVQGIEKEQMIINANRDLITRYEQKIKARLAKVWAKG